MPGRKIIVVGCSAGGVEALVHLVRKLPSDLSAAIFFVHHFPPTSTSALPGILRRNGSLPAHHPENGEAIINGHIYVAPPDYHLLIEKGCVLVAHGPKENGHRPAIDALFRTAAKAYGPDVMGVLLSGMLDDGTAGMYEIKRCGGITLVQDPAEALFPQMPQSAIRQVHIDHVLPVKDMGPMLISLTDEAAIPVEVQPMSSNDTTPIRYEDGMRALL